MALTVEIVTPASSAWKGEAIEVLAPGILGEFGVLPQHAHLLSATRAGVVLVTHAGGKERFIVGPGFAEVGPGEVTLLVDVCMKAEAVDKTAAAEALAAAETVLAAGTPGSVEWLTAKTKAEYAAAQLDA